ncbi:MAG: hypothetical protein K5905_24460 [Roseibium sp.]|uniref:hypothetical protein n=1 Tax=Roseibium sp. TaxID=1936156 RepID=UPI00260AA3EE|nr:hypothetical protein [Roseibium sp.]MCV0428623.1 hypothetical protein [Roseibium sp.]
MARFPFHQSNVRALGELLAKAALDKDFLNLLRENPAKFLSDIGLPKQTTALVDFEIVDQNKHPKAVALPYRLNDQKLENSNSAYLTNLSQMFALN